MSSVASAQLAPLRHVRLGNGLDVVLQRDARIPRVAVVVAYRVGAGHDPAGYRELAHLSEHMTFRGSRHVEPLGAFTHYEQVGGMGINGMTTATHTTYLVDLPAEQLPLALWIESDRMGHVTGAVEEAAFEIERSVVADELRRRNETDVRLYELLWQAAYPEGHPLHEAAAGGHDLDDIEADHVRWFLQTHYRPDNATLVVVGDIEPKETLSLIETYFGSLRGPETSALAGPAQHVVYGGNRQLRVAGPFRSPTLVYRWSLPCLSEPCRAVAHVLVCLLRGALSSHLQHQTGLAREVTVGLYEAGSQRELHVGVGVAHNAADLDEVRDKVRSFMALFRRRPPDGDAFIAARTAAIVAETANWEPLLARARDIAMHFKPNRRDELPSLQRRLELLRSVKHKHLRSATRQWMRFDRALEFNLEVTTGDKVRVRGDEGDLKWKLAPGQ